MAWQPAANRPDSGLATPELEAGPYNYRLFGPPNWIGAQPYGIYGVSFDLKVDSIEAPPPNGWGLYRSSIYTRIKMHLGRNGLTKKQWSVYQGRGSPARAWNQVMKLRRLRPMGVFSTTQREIQLFSIPHARFVVTRRMQLGGRYQRTMMGPRAPMPATLVLAANLPAGSFQACLPGPNPVLQVTGRNANYAAQHNDHTRFRRGT